MDINTVIGKLQSYIITQTETMALDNPVVSFVKPLITRAMTKNLSKVRKALELISDENGNIDIEDILNEMMESIVNTKPFTINTQFIGNIEIGGGEIKLNLPFTSKRLVLNQTDLGNFRNLLISD